MKKTTEISINFFKHLIILLSLFYFLDDIEQVFLITIFYFHYLHLLTFRKNEEMQQKIKSLEDRIANLEFLENRTTIHNGERVYAGEPYDKNQ